MREEWDLTTLPWIIYQIYNLSLISSFGQKCTIVKEWMIVTLQNDYFCVEMKHFYYFLKINLEIPMQEIIQEKWLQCEFLHDGRESWQLCKFLRSWMQCRPNMWFCHDTLHKSPSEDGIVHRNFVRIEHQSALSFQFVQWWNGRNGAVVIYYFLRSIHTCHISIGVSISVNF